MKFIQKDPPRSFESLSADGTQKTFIQDCGEIRLNTDELISVGSSSRHAYDIVCKDFGFYATPSDRRLAESGLRAAIIRNPSSKNFVLIVHENKLTEFNNYLARQGMQLIQWLDECR